jgi:2-methylcitrate dehydratase
MEKVEVREDPSLTRLYPEKIVNRVTLRLKDGRVFMEEVDDPKGHSTNPLTGDEVEAKFRSLTRGFMSDRQAARVIEIVWGIDRVDDVSSLTAACAAPKRR